LSPEERSERTKKLAFRLGFDAVGITDAAPLSGLERFQRWLSLGYHGAMKYLERSPERRKDVRLLAPFARSVVVVLQNYRPDGPHIPPPGSSGRGVARYARGKDYHLTILKRLNQFVNELRAELGEDFQAKVYTDTGAILEREMALRAGLGWIGKSTMLISPTLGTYTLIGVVLTSLEMAADAPYISDHCGTCRACIQACPTSAILEGKMVDARACISYWTIENRGIVPAEYAGTITDWWFGCDICQEVCPWNRRAPATISADFAPTRILTESTPAHLLNLNEQQFRKTFRESPILRPKYDGFRRNLQRIVRPSRDSNSPSAPVQSAGSEATNGACATLAHQIPYEGVG
jgi:epoxyqueuosine reductase